MKTVDAVRRVNLLLMLYEITAELGSERGAQAELARRSKVPAAYISQLRHDIAHSGGAKRAMGDDVARKLEKGMNKPPGWMDHPHEKNEDASEREMVRLYRLLTQVQREHIRQSAELLIAASPRAGDESSADESSHLTH